MFIQSLAQSVTNLFINIWAGCNRVKCICGQGFCWQCSGPPDRSHSCGWYKADIQNSSELSRQVHYWYIHYLNHYKAYTYSSDQESKLKNYVLSKLSDLKRYDSCVRDYSWVTNGLYRLFRSRHVLSYSYPVAFYMFGYKLFNDEMTKEDLARKQLLFEDN